MKARLRLRCQPLEDSHDVEEWLKKEERDPCAVSAGRPSWSPPTTDVDGEGLHHGEGAIIRRREMRHTSSLLNIYNTCRLKTREGDSVTST